ncbi:N-acetylglucosamine kinase [Humibacter sp. RRB41]|uniref:N-acetylglucosamine kinase n=1 Tax=Humibacter sp. RRB41 TaxID=2919946 RepID=UPI001FA9D863|nr:BadF/BadG/BcrA/BcrD ATPase family protein [Humibacter sp. RRB41]
MGNLLAVDAGGTSTRAVVLTREGECLGFGVGGAGNPISSGTEHASREVVTAVSAALDRAGTHQGIDAAVLAMAGSRTYVSTEWITSALIRVGVEGPVELESDLLATFCSGAWEPDGYAIVAGTGAAAIRVHDGRLEVASDGLGWLLGDAGSGFWLGRRVVRAVAAELDARGQHTALTPLLLGTLGIASEAEITEDGRPESLRQLLDAVYSLRPIELATFAPLVFAVGDDVVARSITLDARSALKTTLGAVASADVHGPVVCGGGVLSALGLDSEGVPGVTDVRSVADGTAGAAVLALRYGGVTVDEDVFARVDATLRALRAEGVR